MTLTRVGDQYELRFAAWPWEGQHPRDLTRASRKFTFGSPAPATGVSESGFEGKNIEDSTQLEMFDG